MERYMIKGLLLALVMACVISLFASSSPDGLERVMINIFAQGHGDEHGEEKMEELCEGKEVITAPMPDYVIPQIADNEGNPTMLSASLAGLFGVLLVFGLITAVGKTLKKEVKNVRDK
ncbi:MAG: hypothetical protein MSIBF_02300 [Candidatus Altiarchaeales archaeon IMC4]|nr:MAG: hypothetical protein MSIBF_02300 [Candidatus Altiarchaeales archaeon IMC4]